MRIYLFYLFLGNCKMDPKNLWSVQLKLNLFSYLTHIPVLRDVVNDESEHQWNNLTPHHSPLTKSCWLSSCCLTVSIQVCLISGDFARNSIESSPLRLERRKRMSHPDTSRKTRSEFLMLRWLKRNLFQPFRGEN